MYVGCLKERCWGPVRIVVVKLKCKLKPCWILCDSCWMYVLDGCELGMGYM